MIGPGIIVKRNGYKGRHYGGPETGFRCMGLFREHGMLQARGFDAFGRHFNRAFSTRKAAESFLSAMRRGDIRIERY